MPTKLVMQISRVLDSVIVDIARGLTDHAIAKRHKLAKTQVERTRKDPSLADAIDRAREKVLASIGDDLLSASKKATSVLDHLMDSPTEETRLRAAAKVLDHLVRYRQMAIQHQALTAIRKGHESPAADNVLEALTPELTEKLLRSGAALKALDLSRVPTETIRLVMREISLTAAPADASGSRPAG